MYELENVIVLENNLIGIITFIDEYNGLYEVETYDNDGRNYTTVSENDIRWKIG